MNKHWTHAAMLLLGITLTVGFYEGRRLVRNTSRALTAMSQIGTATDRRERAEEKADAAVAEAAPARRERTGAKAAKQEGKRPRAGGRKGAKKPMDPARIQSLRDMKARQRLQRMDPSRPPRAGVRPSDAPLALPIAPGPLGDPPLVEELPLDEELALDDEELVDTGL